MGVLVCPLVFPGCRLLQLQAWDNDAKRRRKGLTATPSPGPLLFCRLPSALPSLLVLAVSVPSGVFSWAKRGTCPLSSHHTSPFACSEASSQPARTECSGQLEWLLPELITELLRSAFRVPFSHSLCASRVLYLCMVFTVCPTPSPPGPA